MIEKAKVTEVLTVKKYRSAKDRENKRPYEVKREVCIRGINCLLNAGITKMWNLIIGAASDHYDNSGAQLGVGDSNTAADPAQTDLQGTNKTWKAMSATFPQISAQKVTFQAEFGSSEGNHAWEECAVRNGAGGTTLMNRVVASKGTKTSGEVWTAKLEITLS